MSHFPKYIHIFSSSSVYFLCVDGWLDNSASFSALGPYLADHHDFDVVAVDFVGHGHSSHKAGPFTDYGNSLFKNFPTVIAYIEYHSALFCFYISRFLWRPPNTVLHSREVLLQLGMDKAHLICHSMGTGVGMMLTGSFPEIVQSLVMIDGFGPVVKEPGESAQVLRRAIDSRLTSNRGLRGPKVLFLL